MLQATQNQPGPLVFHSDHTLESPGSFTTNTPNYETESLGVWPWYPYFYSPQLFLRHIDC